MVSVVPLHRASHFDPTEVTAYAVAAVAPQVRVTQTNAASIFEILLADQVSAQGSKNPAPAGEAGQQETGSSDGQSGSLPAGSDIRSSRELTIADIQSNRLGFNFARSISSIPMNSAEEILNAAAAPTPDAVAKAVVSQELNTIANSAQRLIPQTMIAIEELTAAPVATSAKTAGSIPPQSSIPESNGATTFASAPNPAGQNSPAVQGAVIPRYDIQAAGGVTKIGPVDASYYIDVDKSRTVSATTPELSVNTVTADVKVESSDTNLAQGQNFSERLSTAVADTLGQMANGGPTSVSIRLTLPELGIVVLYLSLANGAVSVRIGVKNSRAKRTLESQLNDLRNSLLERDVNCDECQVDDESEGQQSAELTADDHHFEQAKPSSLSRWSSSPVASSIDSGVIGAGQLNFTA